MQKAISSRGHMKRVRGGAMKAIFVLLAMVVSSQAQDYRAYRDKLEKNLKQNIIPFWMQGCVDGQNGGYLVNLDENGRPRGKPSNKMIVTQARMLWFFSRLAREGYPPDKMVAAAGTGYRFLRDRM